MPPTTTGAPTPASRERCHDRGDQLAVRAGEDRQADHVDALLERRGCDLRGRQADPFIDHVHAGVARTDGDLLGTVGVAVEAGLADEDLRAAAEHLLQPRDLIAQLGEVLIRGGGGSPRRRPWGRGSCRTPRAACGPTPRWSRPARAAAMVGIIRFSDGSSREATAASSPSASSTAAWSRAALQARTCSICSASTAGSTCRMPPSASAVRGMPPTRRSGSARRRSAPPSRSA